jgi:phage gpG-like protein
VPPVGVISVTVVGADRVGAALGAFGAVLRDLQPFWRDEFAPRFFAKVQDRFNLQGQSRGPGGRFSSGGRWAPLSVDYQKWKERHFPGQPILQRTGVLRDSLVWGGSSVGPDGIFEASPTTVVVGTAVPYGVFHQTGTPKMPARPFIDPPDPSEWASVLRQWVMREARKTGLTVG